jgi:hypothetical protein
MRTDYGEGTEQKSGYFPEPRDGSIMKKKKAIQEINKLDP